jgi:hypothetical protein
MDSFTIPPELKGTKGDFMAARIEVPILAAMIYGIVEFIRLGWSQDHYLYTYASVLGGIAASASLFYLFFSRIRGTKKEPEKSPSSTWISSLFIFAIHHGISWPLHNL